MMDNLEEPVKILTKEQVFSRIPEVNKEVDSFSDWIEVTQLPSKFIAYPEGSRIWYKSFSYGELDRWSKGGLTLEEKVELGMQGIKVDNLEKLDIDLQDFYYLMLLRKLASFRTNQFQIQYTCPHCEEESKSIEELDRIEFDEIEGLESLPAKLILSDGTEFIVSTLTVADFIRFKKTGKEDNRITRIALYVKNKPYEEVIDYLMTLNNIEDMEILDELDELLNFGQQKIQTRCSKCKKPVLVPIQGVSALAEPFRKERRSLKDSLIFSKTQHSKHISH